MGNGYDHELYKKVHASVDIPVIACGGVGEYQHFSKLIGEVDVDAVAAANIFHLNHSVYLAQISIGFNFRKPEILKLKKKRMLR